MENSQRVDVHPYEEAQGFQRLLDLPGYDVTTLVDKSGKSASHIYARLSLLQLIPSIAEAFTQERITASHANLLARLPQESQAEAFEQCWRKDWQDTEPHLLPAKHVAAWIQSNLYLALAEAPFDREDPTLNPSAGACVTCPRRSGHNTSLFCDVQGDQCFDGACYQIKLNAHIDRVVAARPELIQIENGWRNAREQRPGAVHFGRLREIETVVENPDAEPAPPCEAARPAIIVFGKRVGTIITLCTDDHCPVHDPRAAAAQAANPAPQMPPAPEVETEEEAAERKRNYELRRAEYEQERERRAEEARVDEERREKELEAERARTEKSRKARQMMFERILDHAPAMFSASQLRVFLHALIYLDPYTFTDEVAEHFAAEEADHDKTSEEILTVAMDALTDDKLTGFALRMVLTGNLPIPSDGDVDSLTEAHAAFVPAKPKKTARKAKEPVQSKDDEATSEETRGKEEAAA